MFAQHHSLCAQDDKILVFSVNDMFSISSFADPLNMFHRFSLVKYFSEGVIPKGVQLDELLVI